MATHFKGPLIINSGDSTYTGSLAADNLKLDGNTLSSTSGAINITPIAGSAIVLDTSVSIDGGAVDVTGDLDVDNININGNTIISTDTNGAINITPNGTGSIVLDTSVTVNAGAVDITGDLDVDNININGNTIISTDTNGAINLTPNGTGATVITKPTLGSAGSAFVKMKTGTVTLDPGSTLDGDVSGAFTGTITGVAAGDIVICVPPAADITAGLMAGPAIVTTTDTISVRLMNGSGGTVDEASAAWTYLWFDLT